MQRLAPRQNIANRSVIVDSNGAIFFETTTAISGSFRSSKGTSLERIDLTGCIEWRESGDTIRIQFRPSLTTTTARDTILRWLQPDLKRRVHLRYWRNGRWQDEIVGHSTFAARRIEQIIFRLGGGIDVPMIRRPKNANILAAIPVHHDMLAFWNERRNTFNLEEDFRLFQSITGGRAILLRFDSNSGYVVDEAGLCLPSGLRRWMFNRTHQRLSDFPDSAYAKHLGDVYHRAAESLQPITDEVDGLIKFPGVPRQRYSYHRIIIPIQSKGVHYVISSTIKDDTIDLFA